MSGEGLTAADRRRLKQELCRVFSTRKAFDDLFAGQELDLPADVRTVEQAWIVVIDRCMALPLADGFGWLLSLARGKFPYNPVFRDVAEIVAGGPSPAAAATASSRVASSGPDASPPMTRPSGIRILAVATEWSSAHGGLSTLNRRLCTALAERGADVSCLVVSASEHERAQAAAAGVRLLVAPAVPGGSEREALLGSPGLSPDERPHVVIGHGRITGGAAEGQRERFPGALRVHVIHMAPDEIEWHKAAGDTARNTARAAEERTRAEVALALGADLVAAVGPVLTGRFEMELSFDPTAPPVLQLDPGFMPPEERTRTPPPGDPIRVLVLGRLEDAVLKGLDTAAVAVAHASRYLPNGQHLELLVRGAPPGEGTAVREQIRHWAGEPRLRVVPREYTADAQVLAADLRSSSLLLMPSLAEGFGLAGVEGIEAGTPLLASQASGLGVYLGKALLPQDAALVVVNDLGDPGTTWGQEVLRVIRNRDAAFRDADRIRRDLAARRPWSAVADELLTALAALPRAVPG